MSERSFKNHASNHVAPQWLPCTHGIQLKLPTLVCWGGSDYRLTLPVSPASSLITLLLTEVPPSFCAVSMSTSLCLRALALLVPPARCSHGWLPVIQVTAPKSQINGAFPNNQVISSWIQPHPLCLITLFHFFITLSEMTLFEDPFIVCSTLTTPYQQCPKQYLAYSRCLINIFK